MALNLSPGEGEITQEVAAAVDPQASGPESTENVTAPVEQPAADAAPASAEGEAMVAPEATEQALPEAQSADSQPAVEAAQEAPVVAEAASLASSEEVGSDDDAHDLLDELEDLIGRAHHFENAGIERLRADGLALIDRIRNAI